MTEYFLAKTGKYPRTFPNFQKRAWCEKYLNDNKHNSLNLARKYAGIFVLGQHLFLTVFLELRSRKPVRFSAGKYASIFSRQIKAILYIFLHQMEAIVYISNARSWIYVKYLM